MKKDIYGFLINLTIILIIIIPIKFLIPDIKYNFNYIQINLQENIAFLFYFILFGIFSKYYFLNETIGDYLIKNKRNEDFKELKSDILTNIIRLYFKNMVRIIFDFLLFNALKKFFNFIKSKRKNKSVPKQEIKLKNIKLN